MGKHIFAKDIRALLEKGEKRIPVEKGARLTPSAVDLLKDYGAVAVFGETPKEVKPEAKPAEEAPVPAKPAAPDIKAEIRSLAGGSVDPDEVEKIVQRVLDRLAAAKGEEPKKAASSGDDMIICRCEEITRGQIKEAIASGMATLSGIKRITRAGMGLCQGQTCARLVTQILCQELGFNPADVKPVTDRPPTRPIKLKLLATG